MVTSGRAAKAARAGTAGHAVPAALDQASVERSDRDYVFDFCGGHLAVDFTNTVGSRNDEADDHFQTFGDVVAWAEARRVVGRARASRLRAHAAASPEAARREFGRARELRETLYRVLAARAGGRSASASDLAGLNHFVGEVYKGATLIPDGDRYELDTPVGDGLDLVLHTVVRAAVELLTAARPRLGVCADETCGWLFLDETRSGTRRWCDMKVCGNRDKVRRFRSAN